MKVKVQSSLIEPINGFMEIECESSITTSSVIQTFCKKKGVQLLPPNLSLYNLQYKPLKAGATLESLGIEDGATMILGCRNDADDVNIMLKWRIIALIFCILAICGILTVCLLYDLSDSEIPFDYGIVMDAGSTHTQVTLYRWKGDKDEGTGEVMQIKTCKINGGIHNFKNFTEAGNSLLPCLRNFSTSLSAKRMSETPVYLGATAGMRLLNFTDPDLAKAILSAIYKTLKNNNYDVKVVDIISGKTEGLFAWTTANYLSDKLECKEKELTTVGTLDLGGASTQIAYEIQDTQGFKNNTITTLKLYGIKHEVFSKSFLCFGTVEAVRRYHTILVRDSNMNETINDPCGLRGDVVKYTADYLFNHPCTNTKNNETYSDENNANKTYFFNGMGDTKQCAKAVGNMMNIDACHKSYSYCFEPLHQSLTDTKYMAISAYYYLTKFLKLNLTSSTIEEYKTAMDTFCNTTYEMAVNMDPEEEEYISSFCFEAHYIFYILTEEYGFNASQWKNIEFVNKIKKFNVGWSLGYMINATTLIPAEKPQPALISMSTFLVVCIVCALLFIVSTFFVIRSCTFKSQTGYTRIAEA